MNEIKLIISEVNGVITDGTNPIDELGNIPFKNFYIEDFEAINELKKQVKVVFMSADNCVSYHLFRRRNIPFYWAQKNKYSTLLEILRRYNVTADEVVYVASTLSDIRCATTIPNSFCSFNSNRKLLEICNVLNVPMGHGILTELYLKYF